jgi:hypothetical protein
MKLTTLNRSKFDAAKEKIRKSLTKENALKVAAYGIYAYAAYLIDDADMIEKFVEQIILDQ